jgi:hypothetical protein
MSYGSNQSKSSESSGRIFQSEVPVLVEVRDPAGGDDAGSV